MSKNIVITGIGVIAPNGIGKDAFWQALKDGKSGIKPITLFDTTYFKAKTAGECTEFKPEQFLGAKGLRNIDRSTLLVCSAAKLALEDAKFTVTPENTDDIGVVTGTTLATSGDIVAFTKEVVDEGPGLVNPALFPLTTMNFSSSQISIRFNIQGFNTTIATGFSAGIDALKYATDLIKSDKARAVLVCGVEGLTFSTFVGFYKIGFLAGLKGEEICCPFDARHNGIVLGEGAGVILIEDEAYAKKRGANIYAQVKGIECIFDAYRTAKYHPKASGLKFSMIRAMQKSDLSEEDIDYVCAAANSVLQQDNLESAVIKEVFNIYAKDIPVSSIKSMLGESVSASGMLQLAASVGAVKLGFIPPTINLNQTENGFGLDYVPNASREQNVKNVLVNSFGPGGNNSSVIISKYSSE